MTLELLHSPLLADPVDVVMRGYQVMAPAPRLTMAAWADGRIVLSPKVSPEPGPIRLARIPYAVEVLNCTSDPRTREVTGMWAAQVAKTTVFVDIPTAFFMHQDPSRQAVYLEDEKKQHVWSTTRLMEMITNTPDLAGLLSQKGGPDSKNTLEYKEYPGGRLSILNSGSEGDLASMSQRIVNKDELDKWRMLKAGDPDALADKRAQNSFNKKIINVSTPRDHNPDQKIFSRITVKYEASDKRKYYVPCPFCNHEQVLREEQVKFVGRVGDDLEDAKYECEKCKMQISHMHKKRMLERGRWIAEKPFKGHAGFWLNALYSPWITWKEYGEAKIKMVRQHDTHKTFQNEWRALPWNPLIEHDKDISPYLARREYYEKVPLRAMTHLFSYADIQKDRIEVIAIALGMARELWGIEHKIFWGEPALSSKGYLPQVWQDLEAWRQKTWEHESGETCRIARLFIDMSYLTSEVLRFCRGKRPLVWPARGMSDINSRHPFISTRPVIDKKGRYKYYQVGPNEGKDIVFANLAVEPPKHTPPLQGEGAGGDGFVSTPGYMHFNQNFDEEFFKQLLASEVGRWKKGIYVYEKISPATRNEGLDLVVGALAAFESTGTDPRPHVEALLRLWEKRQKEANPEYVQQEEPKAEPHAPRKKNWVYGWKK